jgi:hypothetical protein
MMLEKTSFGNRLLVRCQDNNTQRLERRNRTSMAANHGGLSHGGCGAGALKIGTKYEWIIQQLSVRA